uniref:Si:dkey-194e6.1 n=1 Tax=Macrostomum lignano TaxID=282301 RepID=A0A1I8H0A8_9PLAT
KFHLLGYGVPFRQEFVIVKQSTCIMNLIFFIISLSLFSDTQSNSAFNTLNTLDNPILDQLNDVASIFTEKGYRSLCFVHPRLYQHGNGSFSSSFRPRFIKVLIFGTKQVNVIYASNKTQLEVDFKFQFGVTSSKDSFISYKKLSDTLFIFAVSRYFCVETSTLLKNENTCMNESRQSVKEQAPQDSSFYLTPVLVGIILGLVFVILTLAACYIKNKRPIVGGAQHAHRKFRLDNSLPGNGNGNVSEVCSGDVLPPGSRLDEGPDSDEEGADE